MFRVVSVFRGYCLKAAATKHTNHTKGTRKKTACERLEKTRKKKFLISRPFAFFAGKYLGYLMAPHWLIWPDCIPFENHCIRC